jgi:beta-galactosidase
VVAHDEIVTAGAPAALRLHADRRSVPADGRALTYVTADVVDHRGVVVPHADDLVDWDVQGGTVAGLDNGRQEDAEGYKGTRHTAFNGRALAIVEAGRRPGAIRIAASAPGLRTGSLTLHARPARGDGGSPQSPPQPVVPAVPDRTSADASYSGAEDTVPAAMIDGNTTSGGWSNRYVAPATALLPEISRAHASDWVSLSSPAPRRLTTLTAHFTVDATHARPASVAVSAWDGSRWVPVSHLAVDWATASNQPTTMRFDAVRTSQIRVEMTSSAPGTPTGFLQIAELTASG